MLLMEEEHIIGKTEHLEGSLNMVINKGFCLKLCSDLDFEGMVVDICFDDRPIAMVNYDKGMDSIEIEIVAALEESIKKIFPLDDFINILESSKRLAIKCAKEDELRKQSETDGHDI